MNYFKPINLFGGNIISAPLSPFSSKLPFSIPASLSSYSGGFSCNMLSGAIGCYYNMGAGGFPHFVRMPGTGPMAWAKAAKGAYNVEKLVGSWGGIDPFNPQHRKAYWASKHAVHKTTGGSSKPKQSNVEKTAPGLEAPSSFVDRAKGYFDHIVKPGNAPEKDSPYNSDSKDKIKDWEKDLPDSNPQKGREETLISFAKLIRGWANGDNAEESREKFEKQIKAWGSSIDTKKKLLALIAPGVDEPKNISSKVYSEIYQKLGKNRQPADPNAEKIFDAYYEELNARFGAHLDEIATSLFNETQAMVAGLPKTNKIDGVKVDDIINDKGFTKKEAGIIFNKIFKGKTEIEQEKLFGGFMDVSEDSVAKQLKAMKLHQQKYNKAVLVGKWYLQEIDKLESSDIDKKIEKISKAIQSKTKTKKKRNKFDYIKFVLDSL